MVLPSQIEIKNSNPQPPLQLGYEHVTYSPPIRNTHKDFDSVVSSIWTPLGLPFLLMWW